MTKNNTENANKISDKYMLFRSCAVSNKYPGIESATKLVLRTLGIPMEESEDQSCCGGNAFIFTAIGQVSATILMTARNLALSEEKKLNMLTMCNGCYKNLNEFGKYIEQNPEVRELVNDKLSEINRQYTGNIRVDHVMEVLYAKRYEIEEKINKPFNGMKFAVHYGCHYSFGAKKHTIDDPFNTTTMEEIIKILGGEIVRYAEEKTCCGSGILSNVYIKSEASVPAVMNKFDSLNNTDADAVIVMCPYCMMTLDRMQFQFKMTANKNYSMPVLHIAQLVGLALGENPVGLGVYANITGLADMIKKWEAMQCAG